MLSDKVEEYLRLKEQITALEEKQAGIRNYFKVNLPVILEARDIDPAEKRVAFPVPTSNIFEDVVREKTRKLPVCAFATLKELAPEIYNEVVSVTESTYIEIRRVRIGR